MLCCALLTTAGILLLDPLKANKVLEVGLTVVYAKVSLIYSVYTLVVVIFLIMKLKLQLTLDTAISTQN